MKKKSPALEIVLFFVLTVANVLITSQIIYDQFRFNGFLFSLVLMLCINAPLALAHILKYRSVLFASLIIFNSLPFAFLLGRILNFKDPTHISIFLVIFSLSQVVLIVAANKKINMLNIDKLFNNMLNKQFPELLSLFEDIKPLKIKAGELESLETISSKISLQFEIAGSVWTFKKVVKGHHSSQAVLFFDNEKNKLAAFIDIQDRSFKKYSILPVDAGFNEKFNTSLFKLVLEKQKVTVYMPD